MRDRFGGKASTCANNKGGPSDVFSVPRKVTPKMNPLFVKVMEFSNRSRIALDRLFRRYASLMEKY